MFEETAEAFHNPVRRSFSGLGLTVHDKIPGENDAPAAEMHRELHGELQPESHSEPEAQSQAELKEENGTIEKTELEHRLLQRKAKKALLEDSMTVVQLWRDFFLSNKSVLEIAALSEGDVQRAAFKVFGEKLSAEDVEWVKKRTCEARRKITILKMRDDRKKRVAEAIETQNDSRELLVWIKALRATKYIDWKVQLKKDLLEQVRDSRENTFVREWGIWLLEHKTKKMVQYFGVQDLKDAATRTFGRVPYNLGAYNLLGQQIVTMQLNMLWQKKRVDAKKSLAAKKVRSHAAAVAAAASFANT
jgi:hypothetical protein